jgi:RNA polymerase sigma factor (sigma-70 family)
VGISDQVSVAALEALYCSDFHRFLRVAEAICGDVDLARDAVQDAFASALRSRELFRSEGTLEAWVWRILVNSARKARARGRDEPGEPPEPRVDHSSTNGRPHEADVRAVLAALPERQRVVIFLRYYADLDYASIARILDIAPGTVAATLSAARASVRSSLQEAGA